MWVLLQHAWKPLMERMPCGCAPRHTREGSLKPCWRPPKALAGSLDQGLGRMERCCPHRPSGRQDMSTPQAPPTFLASYLDSMGGLAHNRCSISTGKRKVPSHSPCPFFRCPLRSSGCLGTLLPVLTGKELILVGFRSRVLQGPGRLASGSLPGEATSA